MKRKNCILFLAALIFVSIPGSWAMEMGQTPPKSNHYIFLIHGIGGNKTHFGSMGEALTQALNQKDPDVHYVTVDVEYDTGNNEKTPYDFAKDVHGEIEKVLNSDKFHKGDRISLVMHSQGGLIGSIWLFQSAMNTPGYGSPETLSHVDAFITLGSPFWGAKTAKWGSEIKNLTLKLGVDVPLPFGKRELEEMSFGSDMIFDFRNAFIDPKYRPYVESLKSQIRFLNVAGVANLLDPLGIFVSGSEQYEDDGAVPLASARLNFLYLQSLQDDYPEGDRVDLRRVEEIDMAPYVVVNAMHRSPLPELKNFDSIVQIPKRCIHDAECDHATFQYLWKHILGYEVTQMDQSLGDFKTFLIDLNVRTPKDLAYACEQLNVELMNLDGTVLEESNIEVKKFYEFYSNGARKSDKYPNHCRFYYTGTIKKSLENREEAVLLKVSGEGLKTRMVEMKLRESYSSYVDINLTAAKEGV